MSHPQLKQQTNQNKKRKESFGHLGLLTRATPNTFHKAKQESEVDAAVGVTGLEVMPLCLVKITVETKINK